MKLLNIFKKEYSKKLNSKKVKFQPLDEKQLGRVIGGGDGTILSTNLKSSDEKNTLK